LFLHEEVEAPDRFLGAFSRIGKEGGDEIWVGRRTCRRYQGKFGAGCGNRGGELEFAEKDIRCETFNGSQFIFKGTPDVILPGEIEKKGDIGEVLQGPKGPGRVRQGPCLIWKSGLLHMPDSGLSSDKRNKMPSFLEDFRDGQTP
jgi:hypothetical protein